ncbi:hypothetical protein NMY22_g3989 [Coprinellus aureogranulatus]|nr:hypothetical protein NMY22_g3989 [Coprinellus aureogranulatus]
MAATSTSPSTNGMGYSGNMRGYSDFFASGFRAVSTRVKRRPTSIYSTTSDSSDTEDDAPAVLDYPSTFSIFRSRQQRRQRRPMSMLISSTSRRSVDEVADKRLSLSSFSSRLFERMPFGMGDENAPASAPASPSRLRKPSKRRRFLSVLGHSTQDDRARDSWISTGGPSTPSAPNGQ